MKQNNISAILYTILFCILHHSVSYSQLSGNYIIGTGGNYLTISDAFSDLNSNGINGPVTFEIKSGDYDEHFTVNSFPGSGLINTVTVKSQSGIATDVIIHSDADDSVLMTINGADNLIFKDLTFTDNLNSTSQRNRVMFYGNCQNINFSGCKFTGGIKDAGIISGGSVTKNLTVDHCEFMTRIGFRFTVFSEFSEFTKITNSNFNCVYCIALYYQKSFTVEKNIITGNAVPDYFVSYCLSIAGCEGEIKILKNRMSGISDTEGHAVDGIRCDPNLGDSALIANNMISINSGTCITIYSSKNVKIFYNTLRCDLTHSGNITLARDTNFILKNNILVQIANDGHRTLTYWLYRISLESDHNNFYFNGSDMCYYPPYFFIQNLVQFQTLTGLDLNSTNHPVQFVSDYDLHLAGTSIHDTVLVGVPVPEITDDIDGQPRNPLYPYKGADEADFPLPVVLASFNYSIVNRDVTLNWITSTEQNNSGFEIERSNVKGQTSDVWSKIGNVKGNGTTTNGNNYSYTDRNLASGNYSYRLKQIDFNGNFEYFNLSNEVNIGIPDKYFLSQNYPNPFNPTTNLEFGISELGFVSLKIYDISGKEVMTLVNEQKAPGYSKVGLNGANLSSGIYFYTLKAGDFVSTKKFMLLK